MKFWRHRKDEELNAEIQHHLDEAIRDRIARGETPEEARLNARREFGNVGLVKEVTREMWGWGWLERLGMDVRFGLQMLMKRPGFTFVAVLTLALGIGAATTIFSVLEAVILHPFSFPHQDRLVALYERNLGAGIHRTTATPGSLHDWRKQSQAFEQFVSVRSDFFYLTGAAQPERLLGYYVSANFFTALGVKPLLGRTFKLEEDQAGREQVIVLKHTLWQRRYGSDPKILGQSIELNGKAYLVVGVMAQDFNFPYGLAEFWVPFVVTAPLAQDRESHAGRVLGLLKPGVSLAQGQAEIHTLSLRAQKLYPATNIGVEAFLVGLNEDFTRGMRPYSSLALGGVAFVLLIACANVANLLLARGSARKRELAVRLALGASRWRVMRLLLTESLLLALLGGALGLGFSVWGIAALANGIPQNIPGWEHLGINAWAMGFTFLLSLLTGALCGLLPAWQASNADLNEALKEGDKGAASGTRNRWRTTLVIAEVTLSFVLLVGAGLLIRSFILLLNADLGFNPDNVVVTRIVLPEDRYAGAEKIVNFYQELAQRVAAVPGVAAAGAADDLPLGGWSASTFRIVGQPHALTPAQLRVRVRVATPGYFVAIGTPLRTGRLFTAQDNASAPRVVLVNEAFARRYFADGSALGQQLAFDDDRPNEIVGIVANTMNGDLNDSAAPAIYQPFAQHPNRNMAVIVRGQTTQAGQENVTQMVGALRRELAALDATLPFAGFITLREFLRGLMSSRRVITAMMSIFASLALLMATVGVYGVMSFAVVQRTHEFGIRLALGAQTRDVFGVVVRQGLHLAGLGIILGLTGAIAVTRLLAQMLYGVTAVDPITYALVAGLLLAAVLAGCLVPARRATKIDPMIALRHE